MEKVILYALMMIVGVANLLLGIESVPILVGMGVAGFSYIVLSAHREGAS
jgi:hypothetical protein